MPPAPPKTPTVKKSRLKFHESEILPAADADAENLNASAKLDIEKPPNDNKVELETGSEHLTNGHAASDEVESDVESSEEAARPRRSSRPSLDAKPKSYNESGDEEEEEEECKASESDDDFDPGMEVDSEDEASNSKSDKPDYYGFRVKYAAEYFPGLSYPKGSNWKSRCRTQRCRICHKCVSTPNAAKHLQTEHQIDDIVCCFCPKSFDTEKHLKLHVLMNHPKRLVARTFSLPCKECGIPIIKKECYEHMYAEHKKKNECAFCPYKQEDYDVALLNISDVVDINNASLSPEEKLKRHVIRFHKFRPPAQPVLKCKWCRKTFATEELCKQHKSTKVDPADRKVPLCSKRPYIKPNFNQKKHPEFGGPPILCNFCGKSVKNAYSSYRMHLAKYHDVDKEEVYSLKCPYCPESFACSTTMKKHLLDQHLQPKEDKKKSKIKLEPKVKVKKVKPEFYACEICGVKKKKKDRLTAHMASHRTPEIACIRCGKMFKTKHNLVQHLIGRIDRD